MNTSNWKQKENIGTNFIQIWNSVRNDECIQSNIKRQNERSQKICKCTSFVNFHNSISKQFWNLFLFEKGNYCFCCRFFFCFRLVLPTCDLLLNFSTILINSAKFSKWKKKGNNKTCFANICWNDWFFSSLIFFLLKFHLIFKGLVI